MAVFRRRSSEPFLRFERAGLAGDACGILMEISGGSLVEEKRDRILREIDREGHQPTLVERHDDRGCSDIVVRTRCPDIWQPGAEIPIRRLKDAVLDTLGIGYDERFRLRFDGARSLKRTIELAKKRERGENIEQAGAGLAVPVGSSALGRLAACVGYAAGVVSRPRPGR